MANFQWYVTRTDTICIEGLLTPPCASLLGYICIRSPNLPQPLFLKNRDVVALQTGF